jgi:hypothetical protein
VDASSALAGASAALATGSAVNVAADASAAATLAHRAKVGHLRMAARGAPRAAPMLRPLGVMTLPPVEVRSGGFAERNGTHAPRASRQGA